MNERVEEIYVQMFAPKAIPASVQTVFDRANKLSGRIDAPMRPMDLVIIATIATLQPAVTMTAKADSQEPIVAEGFIEMAEPDADEDDTEAQVAAEDENEEDGPSATFSTSHGPAGVMDAPSRPSKDAKTKTVYMMQKMSATELKVHAREVYGFKTGRRSKKDIIKALKDREPL